jgi:hypothetical protein
MFKASFFDPCVKFIFESFAPKPIYDEDEGSAPFCLDSLASPSPKPAPDVGTAAILESGSFCLKISLVLWPLLFKEARWG